MFTTIGGWAHSPPALRALRTDPQAAMKDSEARLAGSRRLGAAGRLLVTGQVALSLVLLVAAVRFVKTIFGESSDRDRRRRRDIFRQAHSVTLVPIERRLTDAFGNQRTVERWFDASCFAAPPAGRFGNSGVNILEGPGVHLHHLSLQKRFAITEGLNLEYVASISNLLNRPHFRFPRDNISAADPGRITANRNFNQDQNKAGIYKDLSGSAGGPQT